MYTTNINIKGYDLLDKGNDGVRYAWEWNGKPFLLESAAFPQKSKGKEEGISGYTTSVSMGCILRHFGLACRFCRTGTQITYSGMLTPFDIAKQNVLMVLTDMNCSDKTFLRNCAREFAYMGQGEPGYSYAQVRLAIRLTDIIMKELKQDVYRHIVATSGIPEMIEAYKSDMRNQYFDSRVTIHFSLHATNNRSYIMPINRLYPYDYCLDALSDIVEITGEKPCVGIMLFNHYIPKGGSNEYSNSVKNLSEIAKQLDYKKIRVSLCEFNDSIDVGTAEYFSEQECLEIINLFIDLGFEAKLFSSFGKEENTACGMLGGKQPSKEAGYKWLELDEQADSLINNAIKKLWVAKK